MDDPALPPNLAAEIAALRQRVAVLETANRLQASSVRGGEFKVLNSGGDEVVIIGRYLDGTAAAPHDFVSDAIVVRDTGTGGIKFWIDAVNGVIRPFFSLPWQKANDAVTITAGTWAVAWYSQTAAMNGAELFFGLTVLTDAATTAEIRLRSGATVIGGVKTCAAGVQTNTSLVGEHGLPVGYTADLTLEAQRTSGAGNVYVYSPGTLIIGGLLTGANPVPAAWS